MFSEKLKELSFFLYRDIQTQEHMLTYLFWECTLKCNLSCLHCGSDCLKESKSKDMPVEDFIPVLNDIKQNLKTRLLTVIITGGEPLLRKDLEKAGLEIIKRGFHWGIVTNALLMTHERFTSLLNVGLSSISFSFDGIGEDHNYLRQNPLSYKKVCDAIDFALKVQNKYPGRLVFDVITSVHPKNLPHLSEIRDYLISHGVKRWRIFSIFPAGRGDINKEKLTLSKEQYKDMMDFIADTRTDYGDKIHVSYACEGYLGDYEQKVRDFRFFCHGGINIGSVMSDGSISACLSVRGKDFIQGNIYKDKFSDIWNNRFKPMRDREWAKKGKCAECKKWKFCLGNGLHMYKSMSDSPERCNWELLKD